MSLLTLVVWFMNNESGLNKEVKLFTCGFTKKECEYLIGLLKRKSNLKYTIYYVLFIMRENLRIIVETIMPYIFEKNLCLFIIT